MQVQFESDGKKWEVTLLEGETAKRVAEKLPIQSHVQRWGQEIYFEIPKITAGSERGTFDVKVGDLAFWPAGNCLALFFGKTPASTGSEPRPASEVILIGKTDAPADVLRSIQAGSDIYLKAV